MIAAQRAKSASNSASQRTGKNTAAAVSPTAATRKHPEVVVLDDCDATPAGAVKTSEGADGASALSAPAEQTGDTAAGTAAANTGAAERAGAETANNEAPAEAEVQAADKDGALEVEFQVDYTPSSPDANIATTDAPEGAENHRAGEAGTSFVC
jgi:hypothetical protein